MTNKEVKITFRGIDKTRQAVGRMKKNFKDLEKLSSGVSRSFGSIGMLIGAAFGVRSLKQIIDTGDKIDKLSLRLGASSEALSELKYASEMTGVGFNKLSTGLQRMTRRISEASLGSGAAKSALLELGLSAKELNNLNPEEQFEKIADAFVNITNESDKVRLAMKLFDTEGVALLQTMEGGSEAINKLRQEAKDLGLSLSNEDSKAMSKFNDELAKMQVVITGLLTSCLLPMLPVITNFFEALRDGNPLVTFLMTSLTSLAGLKLAAWFIAVAGSVKAFTVALAANPIGLVAVSISAAVAALISLYRWFKRSTNAASEHNYVLEETKQIANKIAKVNQDQIEKLKIENNEQLKNIKLIEQSVPIIKERNDALTASNVIIKELSENQLEHNDIIKESGEQMIKSKTLNEEVFSIIGKNSKKSMDNMIDNFARAAFGAKKHSNTIGGTFRNMFASIQSDLLKLTMNKLLGGSGNGSGLLGSIGNLLGGLVGGSSGGNGGGLLSSIGNSISNFFGGFFAKGGTVHPNKAHIVGDGGGPELFVPNSVGSIVPTGQFGGSNNINVNMNINTPDLASFNQSKGQIITDMAREISRAGRNL